MNDLLIVIWTSLLFVSYFAMRAWSHMLPRSGQKYPPQDLLPQNFWVLLYCIFVMFALFDKIGNEVVIAPRVTGVALIIGFLGVFLCAWARYIFGKPWVLYCEEMPSDHVLITRGPYQFSRHPYYLGLTLWLVGTALLVANVWTFVIAAFWIVGAWWTAYSEEVSLEALFGTAYAEYKKRVCFVVGRKW